MKKKYDIFISYRRNGGDMVSARLYDSLKALKYRVFQDEKEMGACLFDERLREVISRCKDFVLVLTPGALDRCDSTEDWVRKEIEWAQICGCNIIPVRTQDFRFPEGMPDHIRKLDMHNGPVIVASHWESFVTKLTTYFKTKHFPWKRVAIACAGVAAACALAAVGLKFAMPEQYAQLRASVMNAEEALERGKLSKKNQDIDIALAYLNAAVDKGSAEAANTLANMYYDADGVKRDYAKALSNYLKAAELDAAKANEVRIGYMYEKALGVTENYDEALKWYLIAAEEEDPTAINNVGWIYEQRGENEKAFEGYLKSAQLGNAYGMSNLGHCYFDGDIVAKNDVRALEWYEKAEKAGRKQTSMFRNMGILYEELKKDYSKAIAHYETAAADGDAEADYRLGKLYETGKAPGGKNDALALEHYEKAAQKDHVKALNALGTLYYDKENAIYNRTLALEYYLRAAEKDPLSAENYEIGYMYHYGYGTQKDEDKALEWYKKDAETGSSTAFTAIGVIYDNQGDIKKAYEYFLKAAEENEPYALCNLGNLHYSGDDVEQDYAKALEWYLKAEKAGRNDQTMFYRMGWIYRNGEGTAQNDRMALKYYEKAEELGSLDATAALGALYETSNVIPRDYKKAYDYYDKAAKQGNVRAHYRLGRMYLYGNDVINKNYPVATDYLLVAAENNYEGASKCLAEAYINQEMYEQALPWLEKTYQHVREESHDMSDASVRYVLEWLGSIYGNHVDPPDHEKAFMYYMEASGGYESGYAPMMMARYYMEGEEVEQDLDIAKGMLETALERGEGRAQEYLDIVLEMMEEAEE